MKFTKLDVDTLKIAGVPVIPICFPVLVALILAGCLSGGDRAAGDAPWVYSDLRVIDTPGAVEGQRDLAALYTRETGSRLQLRIDLLDLDIGSQFDLYLLFDTQPGGAALSGSSTASSLGWDYRVGVLANGPAFVEDSSGARTGQAGIRVLRDPEMDAVEIDLLKASLEVDRTGYSVEVLLTEPGTDTVIDQMGPVRSDAPNPAPAPVVVVVWNAMNAATPYQALRGWDGAHSGPFYDRHGLRYLLEAASLAKLPVVLADLRDPARLAALDLTGGVTWLRQLERQGVAELPQALNIDQAGIGEPALKSGWITGRAVRASLESGREFGFRTSRALYLPELAPDVWGAAGSTMTEKVILVGSPTGAGGGLLVTCRSWEGKTILPLPASPTEQQAVPGGLSGPVKAALLEAAASFAGETGYTDPCRGQIAVLGGDLAHSAWGDPEDALAAFRFLEAHPWVRVIGVEELAAGKPVAAYEVPERAATSPYTDPVARAAEAVEGAPVGEFREAAGQMLASLLEPPPERVGGIDSLRAGYLGQTGYLIQAAHWAARVEGLLCGDAEACSRVEDVDWDGETEILLVSEEVLAVFERRGGTLAVLFVRGEEGSHQVTGPGTQFATGLSDSMSWVLVDAGTGAFVGEPDAIRGAFSEVRAGWVDPSWEEYRAEVEEDRVTFTAPDGSVIKTIRLEGSGVTAAYQTTGEVRVSVPLALDPWERFRPGWAEAYRGDVVPGGFAWRLEGGPEVVVTAERPDEGLPQGQPEMAMRSFNSALEAYRLPEDPFIDYGPGFLLPMPMAVVDLDAEGRFEIRITLKERSGQ